MKTILTCTFALILTQIVFGQNIYNFYNKNTIGFSSNFLYLDKGINYQLNQKEISYQRVLNNRFSLIASYGFAKNTSSFGFDRSPDFMVSINSNYYPDRINAIGTADIRNSSINLGVREYIRRRGAIAPFGRFVEFKVGYSTVTSGINDDHFAYYYNYNQSSTYPKELLPNRGIDHINFVNFQLGYGFSLPIIKNLYFDCLLNGSLNIVFWPSGSEVVRDNTSSNNDVNYRDQYILENARILYNKNNTVKLNIGFHLGF